MSITVPEEALASEIQYLESKGYKIVALKDAPSDDIVIFYR
jgi:hypothetical protein